MSVSVKSTRPPGSTTRCGEGEIALGYYRVRREIETTPEVPARPRAALAHIILAHHGVTEHGSPVVLATREAALVHAIDDLSAWLGAFDRLETQAAAGSGGRASTACSGRARFCPPAEVAPDSCASLGTRSGTSA